MHESAVEQGRKGLFFEKRSKKLLSVGFRGCWARIRQVVSAQEQKFFASFFQKIRLSFSCAAQNAAVRQKLLAPAPSVMLHCA